MGERHAEFVVALFHAYETLGMRIARLDRESGLALAGNCPGNGAPEHRARTDAGRQVLVAWRA